jgi:hypothetical protein
MKLAYELWMVIPKHEILHPKQVQMTLSTKLRVILSMSKDEPNQKSKTMKSMWEILSLLTYDTFVSIIYALNFEFVLYFGF